MLNPRLTNTPQCGSIPILLNNINCRLDELSSNLYNNIIYELNKKTNTDIINILLFYKRILEMKLSNPDYVKKFTVCMIASKVKRLTLGCKCKCIP